jgi:hypothetical protein
MGLPGVQLVSAATPTTNTGARTAVVQAMDGAAETASCCRLMALPMAGAAGAAAAGVGAGVQPAAG